jgi:hypothetical protein
VSKKSWPRFTKKIKQSARTDMTHERAQHLRDEIKDDLSRFLREAGKEEIVITRHDKPAGAY